MLKTFSGHTGGVRALLVVGLEIWSGSDDGTLRVWDAACALFQLEAAPCRATAFSSRKSARWVSPPASAFRSTRRASM